ncbi:MAG: putative DNA-binding domain-containing protein [Pseudomonadota bacterium]
MATGQPEFTRRQFAFAAHIRDPEHQPRPDDVEDRRMAIYRELFYNNVEGFIANTFPVLRQLLDDTAWHTMVRNYFAHHRAQTPYFLEIPREFLAWLENERTPQADDLPFLQELAHYEWIELALSISEESVDADDVDPDGDPVDGIPVLSPLAWHFSYVWPVHEIGPDSIPTNQPEQPTCLAIYRDRNNEVGFLELNPVTKRLLELVETSNAGTGRALLTRIAGELNHPNPDVVIEGGAGILQQLLEKDIISGTRRD